MIVNDGSQPLVGGFKHLDYCPFHTWDVILPIDELIFFRGVAKNHQPAILWSFPCTQRVTKSAHVDRFFFDRDCEGNDPINIVYPKTGRANLILIIANHIQLVSQVIPYIYIYIYIYIISTICNHICVYYKLIIC